MRELLVCEKWKMPLLDGEGGFYKWLNEALTEIGRHALCIEALVHDMKDVDSVAEPFGGAGVSSVIIRNYLHPKEHYAWEIDDDCLRQLHYLLDKEGVQVDYGDAHDTIGTVKADLWAMDFPSKTIKAYEEEYKKNWSLLLDEQQPKYVIWTDSCARYLHTGNNLRLYSRLLGANVTDKPSYAEAMSQFFYNKHGYSIVRCAWQQSYLCFRAEQVKPQAIEFEHITGGSQGLRLV